MNASSRVHEAVARCALLWCALVAGCAPPTMEDAAVERVRVALAKLPACADRSVAGSVRLEWSCTGRECAAGACCNECALRQVHVTGLGGMTTFEGGSVREVLGIDVAPSDCEAFAIDEALRDVAMSLDEPACVHR